MTTKQKEAIDRQMVYLDYCCNVNKPDFNGKTEDQIEDLVSGYDEQKLNIETTIKSVVKNIVELDLTGEELISVLYKIVSSADHALFYCKLYKCDCYIEIHRLKK